ncbi:MAG: hypothetical protein Q9227_007140 [Pyrenula ochraceoflavens]
MDLLATTQLGALRIEATEAILGFPGYKGLDDDLDAFRKTIDSIKTVDELLGSSFKNELAQIPDASENGTVHSLWQYARDNLEQCRHTLEEFENLIRKIVGKHDPGDLGTWEQIRNAKKYVRKRSKEDQIARLHPKLETYHRLLHVILVAVDIWVIYKAVRAYRKARIRFAVSNYVFAPE